MNPVSYDLDGMAQVRWTGLETMAKPKILCVDDDEVVLLAAQAVLGNRYDIQIANNGETGLELMESYRPDWVVVDYQMPGMDGARFMLSAKMMGLKAGFILLTGLQVGKLDWEGLSPLGLKGHLKKPLEVERLIEIIEGQKSPWGAPRKDNP